MFFQTITNFEPIFPSNPQKRLPNIIEPFHFPYPMNCIFLRFLGCQVDKSPLLQSLTFLDLMLRVQVPFAVVLFYCSIVKLALASVTPLPQFGKSNFKILTELCPLNLWSKVLLLSKVIHYSCAAACKFLYTCAP